MMQSTSNPPGHPIPHIEGRNHQVNAKSAHHLPSQQKHKRDITQSNPKQLPKRTHPPRPHKHPNPHPPDFTLADSPSHAHPPTTPNWPTPTHSPHQPSQPVVQSIEKPRPPLLADGNTSAPPLSQHQSTSHPYPPTPNPSHITPPSLLTVPALANLLSRPRGMRETLKSATHCLQWQEHAKPVVQNLADF